MVSTKEHKKIQPHEKENFRFLMLSEPNDFEAYKWLSYSKKKIYNKALVSAITIFTFFFSTIFFLYFFVVVGLNNITIFHVFLQLFLLLFSVCCCYCCFKFVTTILSFSTLLAYFSISFRSLNVLTLFLPMLIISRNRF